MSTHESERNSSQTELQSHERSTPTHPEDRRSDERRKPWPFDDAGEDGAQEASSNPKIPPPEHDF